jgi:hypothetical protein
MPMPPRRLALAIAAVLVAAPSVAFAAEPCPASMSQNNPAFGTPRPCGPAKPLPAKVGATTEHRVGAPKKVDKVTRENGKTTYTYGDTTVTVGGYVAADMGVTNGKLKP